jgi:transcriptional/translational regulatory protein YebC/TACO1
MFSAVEQALIGAGYQVGDAELRWIPKNESEVSTERAVQNLKLQENLEELDDVQGVSHNLMINDAVIAALETA